MRNNFESMKKQYLISLSFLLFSFLLLGGANAAVVAGGHTGYVAKYGMPSGRVDLVVVGPFVTDVSEAAGQTEDADPPVEGALSGVFSVASGRAVRFAQGNLQYTTTGTHAVASGQNGSGTWRFADNQYDYIGAANSNRSASYSGWIDLFGWGTSGWNSGATAYMPYSNSMSYADYNPNGSLGGSLTGTAANADWGVYNAISNGGNQASLWRTLSHTEWNYLFNFRSTLFVHNGTSYPNVRYCKATVADVAGVVLFPDNYTSPLSVAMPQAYNTMSAPFSSNRYTASEWAALESAGAVFLPAAGEMRGNQVSSPGTYGRYWSSSRYSDGYAYDLYFDNGTLYAVASNFRHYARSVRLVCLASESAGCVTTYGTDVQTACGSFTWIDGNTYTASNTTATYTMRNVAGCDSVVTLNLTINSAVTGTDVQTACGSYTWIDGNTYTASNTTATYTLQSVNGCDSVVTLSLTINDAVTGTDVQTACGSFTWIDGNTYTASNSTATHTLQSVNGCDSVVTLNLTINPAPLLSATNVSQSIEASSTIADIEITTAYATLSVLDLPEGLSFNATSMRISGTPMATSGTLTFTIVASSIYGCGDSQQQVAIEIYEADPSDVACLLEGQFTVSSSGKKVRFSCGNLQWLAKAADGYSDNTWRFAEHQYDFVGGASALYAAGYSTYGPYQSVRMGNGTYAKNDYATTAQAQNATAWIDLFPWGTSGWSGSGVASPYEQPYVHATAYESFFNGDLTGAYSNADWGVYNSIVNGGNAPGLWRTMTKDEWYYLLNTRPDAANKKSLGSIQNANSTWTNDIYQRATPGMILLPDDFTLPAGCSFSSSYGTSNYAGYGTNYYTQEQWAQMEAAGAVFLPAGGYRLLHTVYTSRQYCSDYYGVYWTATTCTDAWALEGGASQYSWYVQFDHPNCQNGRGTPYIAITNDQTYIEYELGLWWGRHDEGLSVRLVHDCEETSSCETTYGTDVQSACDSYEWIDGNTYTESNATATATISNAAGCDSVVTLNLTINSAVTSTDVQTACDSYEWIDGNTYTESNTTATHTLQSINGCDSIVTLNLTISHSTTGTDVQTACDSYEWIDGNTYTESNTTATHTLQSINGCDSMVTLNLTINQAVGNAYDVEAEDSFTWETDGAYGYGNNTTYSESGTYIGNTYTDAQGCEVSDTLRLTVSEGDDNTPECALDGLFSVSESRQVQFSCGNLQWLGKSARDANGETYPDNTWRFANYQYDFCGGRCTYGCPYVNISSVQMYNGTWCLNLLYTSDNARQNSTTWIDLFGWGTSGWSGSGAAAYQPYSLSSVSGDYVTGSLVDDNANADWGQYNNIYNGGNAGTWRLLTRDEWNYLLNTRANATQKKSLGQIYISRSSNYIHGMILLPDDFTLPSGCSFSSNYTPSGYGYGTNSYTESQWDNMQAAGAVFLPMTGYIGFDGSTPGYYPLGEAYIGSYWTSTTITSEYSYTINFSQNSQSHTGSISIGNSAYYGGHNRHNAVRLVHDYVENTSCETTYGTDVQTACGSYTWPHDGNTYTANNSSATATISNVAGCDSIVTLNLTINQAVSSTDVQTACDSYTWIDGNTYTASNSTATHTLQAVNGCDSVVTLNLTINQSTTSTDVQTACDSYTWIDGNTYTESNSTATHTLQTVNGCDSVVTLNLTINSAVTSTDVQTACDSYTWIDGNTYTESNSTATHTLQTIAGCDSVVTLNLTINGAVSGIAYSVTNCDTYTWTSSGDNGHGTGITYSTIGTNTYVGPEYTSATGCPSKDTLHLTLNETLTLDTNATVCDSILWRGTWRKTSGDHVYNFDNSGCASTKTLHLTVNQAKHTYREFTICEGASTFEEMRTLYYEDFEDASTMSDWELGVSTAAGYSLNGWARNSGSKAYSGYSFIVQSPNNSRNALGTSYANSPFIYMYDPSRTQISFMVRLPAVSDWNYDYLPDKLEVYCLEESQQDVISRYASQKIWTNETSSSLTAYSSWTQQTVTLSIMPTTPGYYYFFFRDFDRWSYAAIDNIEVRGPVVMAVPAGLTAGDTVVNDTVTAANGCDSIIHTTWHVKPNYAQLQNYEACEESYPLTYSGQTFTAAATKTAELTSVDGCDSTITITVITRPPALINNLLSGTYEQTVCLGSAITNITFTWSHSTIAITGLPDGVTWNEATGTISGTPTAAGVYNYTITATSDLGCANATRNGTITVNATQSGQSTQTACDSYTWIDGNTYTESNSTATHTLQAVNGCDSVVTLNLTINQAVTGTDVQTACDSYTWIDGNTYTESNSTATHTLQTIAGCDSVVTLNLTIHNPNGNVYEVDEVGSFTWEEIGFYGHGNNETYTESGEYVGAQYTDEYGCEAYDTLRLTITTDESDPMDGTLNGRFSVSETTQVFFSQGNLQYNAAAGTRRCADGTSQPGIFRFAEHQYDWCGYTKDDLTYRGNVYAADNARMSAHCANIMTSESYDGWIDLFGYATSGWKGPDYLETARYMPYETYGSSQNSRAFQYYCKGHDLIDDYAHADWGVYNPISNGGNVAGIWRTLTWNELYYMIRTRANADQKWGLGQVMNTNGLILLPDHWTLPNGYTFTPGSVSYSTSANRYNTDEAWQAMENAGAVFLPVTAHRDGSGTGSVTYPSYGTYWTASRYYGFNSHQYARVLGFYNNMPSNSSGSNNTVFHYTVDNNMAETYYETHTGLGVRLVKTAPECATIRTIDDIQSCDSYTWIDGQTYTESNSTATHNTTNDEGCITITTLNLTINNSSTGDTTAVESDPFTWYGDTYAESGDYTHTLTNTVGCDSVVTLHLTIENCDGLAGSLRGDFSVSPTLTVRFSKGNLQYSTTGSHAVATGGTESGTWQFAEHQYDYIGDDNGNISASYTGWIDLFGWGTSSWNSGAVSYMPYSTSSGTHDYDPGGINTADLTGDYANADWGVYNAISNGGNYPGLWRTLTTAEWYYLLCTRSTVFVCDGTTTNDVRFCKATVNGFEGLILFSDNFSMPAGLTMPVDYNANVSAFTYNTYTLDEWNGMERAGAVFLPAAGNRYTNEITGATVPKKANYWSTTHSGNYQAYSLYFTESQMQESRSLSARHAGFSVRLVSELPANDCTTYGIDVQSACDSYTWIDGVTYAESNNTATYTLENSAGYDSIVTLNLTIGHATTGTDVQTACDSYTWIDGNTYTSNSTATHTLQNAAGCDSVVTLNLTIQECADECGVAGGLNGDYSVSATLTVRFAQGNLQYTTTGSHAVATGGTESGTWRFAEHQYDYIGSGNLNTSATYEGWIDKFCWGTSGWSGSGANEYMPYSASTTAADFYVGGSSYNNLTGDYANADWGVYNAISNGGNQPGMWRTPTSEEWDYLCNTRSTTFVCGGTTTNDVRYCKAKVGDTNGLIIFCDNFTMPSGMSMPASYNTSDAHFDANTYTIEEWERIERAGAVFLPAAGDRNNDLSRVSNLNSQGAYWSSSHAGVNTSSAKTCYFYNSFFKATQSTHRREAGFSVRLVTEAAGGSGNCATYGVDVHTACDSYTWIDGHTYTESNNTATFTLENAAGHDSIVTLSLTINHATTGTDVQTACDSYEWIDGQTYTESNNTATHTLQTVAGCDSVVTLNLTIQECANESGTVSGLQGDFSVSATLTVRFSPGNLQYTTTGSHAVATGGTESGTWRFAEHQWSYIGNSNSNASENYEGWIDLFGWGTSGWNSGAVAYMPYSTSEGYYDYCPGGYVQGVTNPADLTGDYANADWGVYNAISNGGNQPGMWRTLTTAEWNYLLTIRSTVFTCNGVTTNDVRFCKGVVNDTVGLIIFSDNFTMPDGLPMPTDYNISAAYFNLNVYPLDDWLRMENAGAVFLPAAGARSGTQITYAAGSIKQASYWSSTHSTQAANNRACGLYFYNSLVEPSRELFYRRAGFSVRLVTEATETDNCQTTYRTDNKTACNSYTWIDGNTYTESNNTATHTLQNTAGCDSVVTLNLTLHKGGHYFVTQAEPYTWPAFGENGQGTGQTYIESGNYAGIEQVVDGGNCGIRDTLHFNRQMLEGMITGKFSVSDSKKVYFSQGNLQYLAKAADGYSDGTFRFATHQYDYVGNNSSEGNVYMADNSKCSNEAMGENYAKWVDLFGYGTSGWDFGGGSLTAYMPYATSQTAVYVKQNLTGSYAQSDWGMHNPIVNGGNYAGLWRTLTKDEWTYLFNGRADASQLRSVGTANGVRGLIVLPDRDQWQLPQGCSFTPALYSDYTTNSYTAEQWAQMEAAGAVFFPQAGVRTSGTNYATSSSSYWTATWDKTVNSYFWNFVSSGVSITTVAYYRGASVRLACDAPAEGCTVSFGTDAIESVGSYTDPVSGHVYSESTTFANRIRSAGGCDSIVTITLTVTEQPAANDGALNGAFSVSATQQVNFSKGNLQYLPTGTHRCADGSDQPGTWQFAERQYIHVGNTVENRNPTSSQTEYMDLFGWATSGWSGGGSQYMPYAIGTTHSAYGSGTKNMYDAGYEYLDWGKYNAISNGGNQPGLWFTMSSSQWEYLLDHRAASTVGGVANARYAKSVVSGQNGLILFPDTYVHPDGQAVPTAINDATAIFSANFYDANDWMALEEAGAVFLPATGYRYYNYNKYTLGNIDNACYYWTSTSNESSNEGAYQVSVISNNLQLPWSYSRGNGNGVRLVRWAQ